MRWWLLLVLLVLLALFSPPQHAQAVTFPNIDALCSTRSSHGSITDAVLSGLKLAKTQVSTQEQRLAFARQIVAAATAGNGCWRPDRQASERLVKQSDALSHLVASTAMRTTDNVLRILFTRLISLLTPVPQRDEIGEEPLTVMRLCMFLLSSRNDRSLFNSVSMPTFFFFDKQVANFWFGVYIRTYETTVSEQTAFENLKWISTTPDIYQNWHIFDEKVNTAYYAVSYYHTNVHDRGLKQYINKVLQSISKQTEQRWIQLAQQQQQQHAGTARVVRVAVVTQFWFKRHSVYRTLAKYVEALTAKQDKYQVDLLVIGKPEHDTVQDGFHRVLTFEHDSDLQKSNDIINTLRDEQQQGGSFNYDLVYFPDVGMSWVSMFVANHRVGPIMAAGVGHSASSHSLVDYFISGDRVEPKGAHHHYTERLVLLPGAGVVHNDPKAIDQNIKQLKSVHESPGTAVDTVVRVACSFSMQKLNYPYLYMLRSIIDRVRAAHQATTTTLQTLKFTFFTNLGKQDRLLLYLLRRAIRVALIGDVVSDKTSDDVGFLWRKAHVRIRVNPLLPYDKYITKAMKTHLFLESYHYGGCNTIVDAILCGKPIVTLKGNQWNNRIGSVILEQVQLDKHLVTHTKKQFIDKAVSLILDDRERQRVTEAVKALEHTHFRRLLHAEALEESKAFEQTMDFLLQNHHKLRSRRQQSPPKPLRMRKILAERKEKKQKQKTASGWKDDL